MDWIQEAESRAKDEAGTHKRLTVWGRGKRMNGYKAGKTG